MFEVRTNWDLFWEVPKFKVQFKRMNLGSVGTRFGRLEVQEV